MQKEELLRILRQEGESSGEALGRRFGVSRAAVSKAVAALRREGYEISSTPNRGYRLVGETDALSRSGILADLGDHPWAEHLRVFPIVDSTNDWLKAAAAEGAPHGTVAVADCQTGGGAAWADASIPLRAAASISPSCCVRPVRHRS